MRFINIGFGSIVNAGRVIAIAAPDTNPMRRIIHDAQDRGQLVDATFGRRTRSVIVMDSGHVVLSGLQPETLSGRLNGGA